MNEDLLTVAVIRPVVVDQFGNDIHSEISLDRELEFFHPIQVSTSDIEQSSGTQLNQKFRYLIAKCGRADQTRPRAGNRFWIAPDVMPIGVPENLLHEPFSHHSNESSFKLVSGCK